MAGTLLATVAALASSSKNSRNRSGAARRRITEVISRDSLEAITSLASSMEIDGLASTIVTMTALRS